MTGNRTPENISSPESGSKDIIKRSGDGFIAMLISRGAVMGLGFITNITLSRLLGADDYGIVTSAAAILLLVQVVRDVGLGTAIVQRETLVDKDINSAFFINLVVSILAGLLFFLASDLIASYYSEPRLVPIVQAMALTITLSGAPTIHLALLRRKLRFKAVMWCEVASALAGLLVGVGAALWLKNYWAIVLSGLSIAAINCVIAFTIAEWRPSELTFTKNSISILRFGGNVLLSNLTVYLSNTLMTVFVAKGFSLAEVGYFSRAQMLYTVAGPGLLAPIHQVIVPTLSRLNGSPETYSNYFRSVVTIVSFVFSCISLVLLGCPGGVATTLLGSKWIDVGTILFWFGFAVMSVGLSSLCSALMISQGRVAAYRNWGVVDSIFRAGTALALMPLGIEYVAAGFALGSLMLATPGSILVATRSGPVSIRRLLNSIRYPLLFWLCMIPIVLVLSRYTRQMNSLLGAGLTSAVVAVGAVLCFYLIPGIRSSITNGLRTLRPGAEQR